MRRNDQIITAIRTISRNALNADGTYAISDDEILQYMNDAQDRLQNLISSAKNVAKIFVTQKTISVASGQEGYTIPDRVLLNKQIESVEFSATGAVTDYLPLEKLNFFNRDTNTANYPWGYIKRGGQILIQPTPSVSTGSLRVQYERELDELDIPRGVISSITNGTSTGFDALVLDSTANAYESTTPGWSNVRYCCVVDTDGARRCFNIPISSYNTGSNTVTPTGATFVYATGDSQIQVGDVCVFGTYATTYCQLPDNAERYIIHYAAAELFHRDSSSDHEKEIALLGEIEKDIIQALSSQTSEVQYIPQLESGTWW